jgi:phage repressor protein C with HTH and peptisase S24 domain
MIEKNPKNSTLLNSEASEFKATELPGSVRELGSFAARLKLLTNGQSIRSFAAACNLSDGVIRQYLAGKSEPGLAALLNIAQCADVSVGWLATGEGEMRGEAGGAIDKVPAGNALLLPFNQDDFIALKVYAMTGAGSALDAISPEAIAEIIVPKEFHRPSIKPVQVRGESMQDTIREGAYVGIDTDDKKVVSGKIYAIWLPYEGMTIKRLFMSPDKVTCRSDNSNFPEFSLLLKDLADPFIQGRVRWVVQTL